MPATKKIQYFGADTGKTIYAVIMRCSDGFILDSDFHFKALPLAPARIFAEKTITAMASKIYEFTDATDVWDDGLYQLFFYEEVAPPIVALSTDTHLTSATVYMKGDAIYERSYSYSAI
jgi:hypothetical protein